MSETIEFEARLVFAAHRGCGSVITTWPPSTGERNISQCEDGRYRVTLTPVEPELKPCPRCGGDMNVKSCGPRSWWLVCGQCDRCSPPRHSRADAIAAHNARKSPELDLCPFCGGAAEVERGDYPLVVCLGCGVRTRCGDADGAIATWNRRAP